LKQNGKSETASIYIHLSFTPNQDKVFVKHTLSQAPKRMTLARTSLKLH